MVEVGMRTPLNRLVNANATPTTMNRKPTPVTSHRMVQVRVAFRAVPVAAQRARRRVPTYGHRAFQDRTTSYRIAERRPRPYPAY